MSDSLTRLILRAQGRQPPQPMTAEPLLASRHESAPGSAWAGAEPWTAYEIEADGSSRQSAYDAGSRQNARASDGPTSRNPWASSESAPVTGTPTTRST